METEGSLVNPNPGDQWIQVRFDLVGNMADFPGAKSKVWLAADSGGPLFITAVQ